MRRVLGHDGSLSVRSVRRPRRGTSSVRANKKSPRISEGSSVSMYARNRSLCETRDQCLLFHHHAPTVNALRHAVGESCGVGGCGTRSSSRTGFRADRSIARPARFWKGANSDGRKPATRTRLRPGCEQAGQSRLRRRASAEAAGPGSAGRRPPPSRRLSGADWCARQINIAFWAVLLRFLTLYCNKVYGYATVDAGCDAPRAS